MRRTTPLRAFAWLVVIGCSSSSKPATAPAPERALAGMAGQHVIVTPAYAFVMAPDVGWSVSRPTEVLRTLDADIAAALEERGLKGQWIFASSLVQNYQRNPTYATDPYKLSMEQLRSPALESGALLGEPLASQLRTMIALTDARYVLAPVELKVEHVGTGRSGGGRGELRLVLIDARRSDVRWIGRVDGDTSATMGPAVTASVAAKVADLVTAP
jgi:hypothetical protein